MINYILNVSFIFRFRSWFPPDRVKSIETCPLCGISNVTITVGDYGHCDHAFVPYFAQSGQQIYYPCHGFWAQLHRITIFTLSNCYSFAFPICTDGYQASSNQQQQQLHITTVYMRSATVFYIRPPRPTNRPSPGHQIRKLDKNNYGYRVL